MKIKSYQKKIGRKNYCQHTHLRKTKKKISALQKGGAEAPPPAAELRGQIQEEISEKLQAQFEVLGNETRISINEIFPQLYEDLAPSTITKAGTKRSGSLSPKSITKQDEFIDYCQSKYEHYEQLPHKTLVVGCFHSDFSLSHFSIPDNVCLCFSTPLMEYGMLEDEALIYHNFEDGEITQDVFNSIFRYKQTLITDKLKVNIDGETSANSSNDMKINYFKNSSWYYPGQKCPSVSVYVDQEDLNQELLGIYEVTDESKKYKKDTSKIRNKSIKTGKYYTLPQYIEIYNTKPNHQYIFIINGCRFLTRDLKPFELQRQIREQRIIENIPFNLNYQITQKNAEKNRDSLFLKALQENKIEGIPELIDIFDYNTMDLSYYFFNNSRQEDVGDDFKLFFSNNFKNNYQTSRKNKVYLDIRDSIYHNKDIDRDEVFYLQLSPLMKALRFILNLIRYNKTLKDPERLNVIQMSSIVSKILNTYSRRGNMLDSAFNVLNNFYFLLKETKPNILYSTIYQTKFLDEIILASNIHIDIILEFQDVASFETDKVLPFFSLFKTNPIFINPDIHKKLPEKIKESLSAIHLVSQIKTDGFDLKAYKKLISLKLTYDISILDEFDKLAIRNLEIESLNYNTGSVSKNLRLLPQFINLRELKIQFNTVDSAEDLNFSFTKLKFLDLSFKKKGRTLERLNVNLDLPSLTHLNLDYESIEEDKILVHSLSPFNLTELKLNIPSHTNFNFSQIMTGNLNEINLSFLRLNMIEFNLIIQYLLSKTLKLKKLSIQYQGYEPCKLDISIFKLIIPFVKLQKVVFENFELETESIIEFLKAQTIKYKLYLKTCINYDVLMTSIKKSNKTEPILKKNYNYLN